MIHNLLFEFGDDMLSDIHIGWFTLNLEYNTTGRVAGFGISSWLTEIPSPSVVTKIESFSVLHFKPNSLIMALRERMDMEMEEVICFLLF